MTTGYQDTLLQAADLYLSLGYQVGLSKGKVFIEKYRNNSFSIPSDFDGLSLIPIDFVVVDIDNNNLDIGEFLPATLKDKTPRGYHLFYNLPTNFKGSCKIKWKPHVDLLLQTIVSPKKVKYRNEDDTQSVWSDHVLITPTKGYQRIYPDDMPAKNKLTMAPDWLLDELRQ